MYLRFSFHLSTNLLLYFTNTFLDAFLLWLAILKTEISVPNNKTGRKILTLKLRLRQILMNSDSVTRIHSNFNTKQSCFVLIKLMKACVSCRSNDITQLYFLCSPFFSWLLLSSCRSYDFVFFYIMFIVRLYLYSVMFNYPLTGIIVNIIASPARSSPKPSAFRLVLSFSLGWDSSCMSYLQPTTGTVGNRQTPCVWQHPSSMPNSFQKLLGITQGQGGYHGNRSMNLDSSY